MLIGQDVVDFSLLVESSNVAEHTKTLLIQHVPPPALHVEQPAAWMQQPPPTKPNNFVQVPKEGSAFIAETGTETSESTMITLCTEAICHDECGQSIVPAGC